MRKFGNQVTDPKVKGSESGLNDEDATILHSFQKGVS